MCDAANGIGVDRHGLSEILRLTPAYSRAGFHRDNRLVQSGYDVSSAQQVLRFRDKYFDQFARRQLAAEGRRLPGQHGREIARSLRLRLGVQRRQRTTGERKLRHNRADRPKLADGPVDQAARRPAAEHVGEHGAVVARGPKAPRGVAAVVFASGQNRNAVPIWTAEAPSANAATMPRASPIPPVAMTGIRHGIDDLRQQREQPNLRGDVVAQKHAAMTAGFDTLRDHSVAAVLLQVREPRQRSSRRK